MTKQYSVARTIDARPDVVWALLTDAAGYGNWNPAVVSIQGPIEAGTTIELVSIASPKRTFKLKVAVMEPPHLMVSSDAMALGLFKGERTYRLRDRDGGTEFSMTEECSAGSWCERVVTCFTALTNDRHRAVSAVHAHRFDIGSERFADP